MAHSCHSPLAGQTTDHIPCAGIAKGMGTQNIFTVATFGAVRYSFGGVCIDWKESTHVL